MIIKCLSILEILVKKISTLLKIMHPFGRPGRPVELCVETRQVSPDCPGLVVRGIVAGLGTTVQ